jgi:O-antigen/teichoic acid export membrane protein
LDKTLAVKLLPLGAAGVYAAAARVIGAITLPVTAMTLSSLPRLFREGNENPDRTTNLLRRMFATAAAYSIVLAGVVWVLAPVFEWVFGSQYHDFTRVIRWLCVAVPGMALRLTAGNVLMALGKPWMRVAFEATGLLILVTTSTLMAPQFVTVGMPVALACAEWGMAAGGIALVVLRRRQVQSILPYNPP